MSKLTNSYTIIDVSDGKQGSQIWTSTTAPIDNKFQRSNLEGMIGITPQRGDTVFYDVYKYFINSVDAQTVTVGSGLSIRGAAGNDGANVATLFIFKPSATQPSLPTEDVTYNFTSGEFGNLEEQGWYKSISSDDKVWVSTATAYSTTGSATVIPGKWETPVVYKDKVDGVSSTYVTLSREFLSVDVDYEGKVRETKSYAILFDGNVGDSKIACSATTSCHSDITCTVIGSTSTTNGTITVTFTKDKTLGNDVNGEIEVTFELNGTTRKHNIIWQKSINASSIASDIMNIKDAMYDDDGGVKFSDKTETANKFTQLYGAVFEYDETTQVYNSKIEQNAEEIALKASFIDSEGNAVQGSLQVQVDKEGSTVKLNADEILLDGSVKAEKITIDSSLDIKSGGKINGGNKIAGGTGTNGFCLDATTGVVTADGAIINGEFSADGFSTQKASDVNPYSISSTTINAYCVWDWHKSILNNRPSTVPYVSYGSSSNQYHAFYYPIKGMFKNKYFSKVGFYMPSEYDRVESSQFPSIGMDGDPRYGTNSMKACYLVYFNSKSTGVIVYLHSEAHATEGNIASFAGILIDAGSTSDYTIEDLYFSKEYIDKSYRTNTLNSSSEILWDSNSNSDVYYYEFNDSTINKTDMTFVGTVKINGSIKISTSTQGQYFIRSGTDCLIISDSSSTVLYRIYYGNKFSYIIDISVASGKDGIATKHVIPYSDNMYDLGSTLSRFKNAYITNIYGNVNSQDDRMLYKVWGAVAN